jgi:hypothetical protein
MPALAVIIRETAGIAGAASIAYGAWLIYRPAGFIVAGALLLAGSILDARSTPAL